MPTYEYLCKKCTKSFTQVESFNGNSKIKCKYCKGLGFYTFPHDQNTNSDVEYYCEKCNGEGKIWKDVEIPLSSFKRMIKDDK